MDSTRRFSGRVEDYVRYRPGYPSGVIEVLRGRCGLDARSAVVDVGSGTGALSRLFLENGNRVLGVEPNPQMRHAGDRLLAEFEGFTSVDGTAEATTLEDDRADFVTAGQAFHWFDPAPTRREFARILRPGGLVVLVWNERRSDGAGFPAAYEGLLRAHGTDYEQVRHGSAQNVGKIRHFFKPCAVETAVFDNEQTLDFDGIRGRLLSSSYTPAEGEPGREAMIVDLKGIFERYASEDRVTVRYDTRVYFGTIAPG